MSKTKHTQGPWRFQADDRTSGCQIRASTNEIVARTSWLTKHPDADAALIASAPELLEAAIRALDVLKNNRPSDAPSNEYAQRLLADAIAKAVGNE